MSKRTKFPFDVKFSGQLNSTSKRIQVRVLVSAASPGEAQDKARVIVQRKPGFANLMYPTYRITCLEE